MKRLLSRLAIGIVLLSGYLVAPLVAQGVIGVFQNGLPTAPSAYGFGDILSGVYFGTNRVGLAGHAEGGLKTGQTPVASICGAQPAAGSTDFAGTITNIGTTTCTITFGTTYAVAPSCVIWDQTNNRAGIVAAVSATAITVTAITAADVLSWICVAKSGG